MNKETAAILKKIMGEKPPKGKIIKTCVAGSHAYGLAGKKSDLDVRGIFMLPNSEFYGLDKPKDEWALAGYDAKWFEIGKFMNLASKGNPGILELLFTAPVYHTKEYQVIYDNRNIFLGAYDIVAAHRGWARSEMEAVSKLEDGPKKFKRISHVMRLLIQCEFLLREGYTPVKMPESILVRIKAVKNGKLNYEAFCEEVYAKLLTRLTKAEELTILPQHADRSKVNDLLIKIRRM